MITLPCIVGIHHNGDGVLILQSSQKLLLTTAARAVNVLPACELSCCWVLLTGRIFACIWVFRLQWQSILHNPVHSFAWHSAAASIVACLVTRNQVLLGERQQFARCFEVRRLSGCNGGKGPTRSTRSLIFHWVHITHVAVINLLTLIMWLGVWGN